MSENINSTTPFDSGGHRWMWSGRPTLDKRVGAVGTFGESRTVLRQGGRSGTIVGMLKAEGESTRALADAAMTALEDAWEALVNDGLAYAAEDDQGHTIAALSVDGYRAVGPRQYSHPDGGNWSAWQRYEARVTNLWGEWAI